MTDAGGTSCRKQPAVEPFSGRSTLALVVAITAKSCHPPSLPPQGRQIRRLECLADHPSNRIDELLPWVVAAKWADDASAKDMPLAA